MAAGYLLSSTGLGCWSHGVGISTESSRPSGCSLGMEAGELRLSVVGDEVDSSRLKQNDFCGCLLAIWVTDRSSL